MQLPPRMPPPRGEIDLDFFTGRDRWPDARDRMIYWHAAANLGYLPGTVDYVLHEEQIALTPRTEPTLYSAVSWLMEYFFVISFTPIGGATCRRAAPGSAATKYLDYYPKIC